MAQVCMAADYRHSPRLSARGVHSSLYAVAARTVQGMARVRAGQAPAWPWSLAGGVQRLRCSRAGPEDHFCAAVRNDLRVPLMVEGHPRTLSGPSPDLNPLIASLSVLAGPEPGSRCLGLRERGA